MFTPKSSATIETPTRWTPKKLLQNDAWLSLDEAKKRAHGEVEWWKCPNIDGEQVDFLQTPNPVWSNGSKMYVGGWQKHPKKAYFQWHGPGVYYRQDGRILVGKWVDGKLKGLTKRLWCPDAPCWVENRRADSVIKNSEKQGVPFIYIGKYKGHCKEDKHAVVILKDGTTRKGPWKRNAPVGDWWKDHEKGFTSPEEISRILGFDRIETNVGDTTDDESEAPTVVAKNTSKRVDAERKDARGLESQVSEPDYLATAGKREVRRVYLEPDTSEAGEEMPGTALAHTIEDDEEEIVFVEGDSMDVSLPSESPDVHTPLRTNVSKEMSIDDPQVSPISTHNEKRSVIQQDLPQKLLFGNPSDEISQQEASDWTVKQDHLKVKTSHHDYHGGPAETPTDEVRMEEVPNEYKETSAGKMHKEFMADRTGLATPIRTPALTESSTASSRPYTTTYDYRDSTYNMDQLSALVDWLMIDVIGSNPSRTEMEQYARHFLDVGLHSSLMITSACTTADAANFSWMKPFHRRCFVLWAHKHCDNEYQRQLVSVTTWLQFEVIGNDADVLEMGFYARKLVSAGFHSVRMIQAVCTYEDVDAFDWMKPIHKRLFLLRTGIVGT